MSKVFDDSLDKSDDLGGGLLKNCLFLLVFVAFSAVGCHELNVRYGSQIESFLQSQNKSPVAADAKLVSATAPAYDMRGNASPATTVERVGVLKRRSTLYETLTDMGADADDAQDALQSLYDRDLVDPRRVIAGMTITANFNQADDKLLSISFSPENGRHVFAKRLADNDYFASDLAVHSRPSVKLVAATISTSLYEAALEAGATDQQVADFAQIFAFDIDFQREIQAGDEFEILYETLVDERGNFVSSGEILFASLNGRALERSFYRHTPSDDNIVDYFTADGKSATRFLMKTPINGARLSSSFGRRRHPISGYSRLHKGTDFAARSGTPIFAAGNGVVERASRYGGYGKYVRIQHANGYETAYAHMSRYGPGVRKGRRVRQGDIIGYVGSTGASTGPHLHYEVLINGRHVNAMTLRLPTGRTLEGDLLAEFDASRQTIDAQRDALSETLIADTNNPVIGRRSK